MPKRDTLDERIVNDVKNRAGHMIDVQGEVILMAQITVSLLMRGGTVDFIFGSSIAVFDGCTIYRKRSGFYTAASTPEGKKFGYKFLNCNIT